VSKKDISTRLFNEVSVYEIRAGTHLSVTEEKRKNHLFYTDY